MRMLGINIAFLLAIFAAWTSQTISYESSRAIYNSDVFKSDRNLYKLELHRIMARDTYQNDLILEEGGSGEGSGGETTTEAETTTEETTTTITTQASTTGGSTTTPVSTITTALSTTISPTSFSTTTTTSTPLHGCTAYIHSMHNFSSTTVLETTMFSTTLCSDGRPAAYGSCSRDFMWTINAFPCDLKTTDVIDTADKSEKLTTTFLIIHLVLQSYKVSNENIEKIVDVMENQITNQTNITTVALASFFEVFTDITEHNTDTSNNIVMVSLTKNVLTKVIVTQEQITRINSGNTSAFVAVSQTLELDNSTLPLNSGLLKLTVFSPSSGARISVVFFDDKISNLTFPNTTQFHGKVVMIDMALNPIQKREIRNSNESLVSIEYSAQETVDEARARYNKVQQPIITAECNILSEDLSDWSHSKTWYDVIDNSRVKCYSRNSGIFSVLLNVTFKDYAPHPFLAVGVGLAIAAAFFCLLAYLLPSKQRTDPIDHLNLQIVFTTMATLTFLFAAIVAWGTLSRVACLALTAFQQLFLLLAFFWLGLSAHMAHRCLLNPHESILSYSEFTTNKKLKLIKWYYLWCSIFPLLLTAITVVVGVVFFEEETRYVDEVMVLGPNAYTEESFCAARGPLMYVGIALPCAVVMIYCYVKVIQLLFALTVNKIPVEDAFYGRGTLFQLARTFALRVIYFTIFFPIFWVGIFIRISILSFAEQTYLIIDIIVGILAIALGVSLVYIFIFVHPTVRANVLKFFRRNLGKKTQYEFPTNFNDIQLEFRRESSLTAVSRNAHDMSTYKSVKYEDEIPPRVVDEEEDEQAIAVDRSPGIVQRSEIASSPHVAKPDVELTSGKYGLTSFVNIKELSAKDLESSESGSDTTDVDYDAHVRHNIYLE